MQLKQLIKSKCPTVPINNNTFLFFVVVLLTVFPGVSLYQWDSGTLGHQNGISSSKQSKMGWSGSTTS
jgi:hypothetical protein